MTNPQDYRAPQLYVAGEWISDTGSTIEVINPATGNVIGAVPAADDDLIDRALAAASAAFPKWRDTPAEERAAILRDGARLLLRDLDQSAIQLTIEQGKPLGEARAELESCATILNWCAEEAVTIRSRDLPDQDGFKKRSVIKEAIGPVAAFAPWNFPASLATRKVASALAVGCSIIVKPAEEAPNSFLAVARALHEAGLPAGVLNVLFGHPAQISDRLIRSPVIRKISFTGSTRVGSQLATLAGTYAKPCVLELGGHAPVVICDDIDIDAVSVQSVASKLRNSGQVCISPTRFYVQDSIYDRFTAAIVDRIEQVVVGDGLEDGVQMGPLASRRQLERLDELVGDAVAQGARCLTGGKRMDRAGYFFSPTVLADVPATARIMQEEPFGPVVVLNRFGDLGDAIEQANSTDFALGAYAFSNSAANADALVARLDAGMVAINNFSLVHLDSPIGGRRMSGYGSDGGKEGLDAYCIPKFVSRS